MHELCTGYACLKRFNKKEGAVQLNLILIINVPITQSKPIRAVIPIGASAGTNAAGCVMRQRS